MRSFLRQYSILCLLAVGLVMAPGRRARAQSLAQDIEQLVLSALRRLADDLPGGGVGEEVGGGSGGSDWGEGGGACWFEIEK